MSLSFGVGVIGVGLPSPTLWTSYERAATGNGLSHAEFIMRTPHLKLKALCDIVEDETRAIGDRLNVPVFTDYRDLLAQPDIDIVTISTPNSTHAEIATAALMAGKHVVLEKPMCISTQDCERLINAFEDSGKKLLVNHIQRFAPRFQEARRLALAGGLGTLYYGESAVIVDVAGLMAHGWRGDPVERHTAMIGHASHAFDLLRWIFGEVAEVIGYGTSNGARSVPYNSCEVALLKFESGAVARVLGIQRCIAPLTYQLQIWGTEGTIIDDSLYLKSEPDKRLEFGVKWEAIYNYQPMYKHFVDCIVRNRSPLIDVYDGANAVALALAADEAIRTGVPVHPRRYTRPTERKTHA